jgi:MFS family permease
VQLLDGVGAGIFGALFPLVVADLTRGTGRFNVSQGAIATAQGIGASLSNTVAGLIIVWAGYSAAFLFLGGVAAIAFLLYWLAMPETLKGTSEARQSVKAALGEPRTAKMAAAPAGRPWL